MTIPKNYFHDRMILLLLSINVFMAVVSSLWVLFKLDAGRGAVYIVQYRSALGNSALKPGDASALLAFVAFALMVLVVHTVLSLRTYGVKREVSVLVLAMGALLLISSLIVSNALLVLR